MTYAVRVEKELEVEESPNFAVSWIKGCLSIVYQFLVLRTIAALNVPWVYCCFFTREYSVDFASSLSSGTIQFSSH